MQVLDLFTLIHTRLQIILDFMLAYQPIIEEVNLIVSIGGVGVERGSEDS